MYTPTCSILEASRIITHTHTHTPYYYTVQYSSVGPHIFPIKGVTLSLHSRKFVALYHQQGKAKKLNVGVPNYHYYILHHNSVG